MRKAVIGATCLNLEPMRIKTKLYLGMGALFAMIVGMSLLSALSINQLTADARRMLQANYNTLEYSRSMMLALDNDLPAFEAPLAKQQANITEPGEQALTDSLAAHYASLKASGDAGWQQKIRVDLSAIMLLNMQAIEQKTQAAEANAETANLNIVILGTFCFLVAFTLLLNLPANIANPIKKLNESIAAIARRNYGQRVHVQQGSEFAELATNINALAEKLEEYESSNLQQLQLEKRRLDTLISNLHDPVLGLDEKGIIVFVNEAACQLVGLSKTALLGSEARQMAAENALLDTLMGALKGAASPAPGRQQSPLRVVIAGKDLYYLPTVVPIDTAAPNGKMQRHLGDVILLQDVTPFKELDAAKTHFIAMVSHELKTPLASIQMSTKLLADSRIGPLNAEQVQLVQHVADDTSRLLKITTELLNMAQVETGHLQLNTRPVAVAQLMDYALSSNRAAALEKNITVQAELPAHLPLVLADADKTSWVLTNLLSNAIRYSYEHSTVQVAARLWQGGVELSVQDAGPGIGAEHLPRIFDRYYRVPGSRQEGTGLGLSTSRELMIAQGGNLMVESDDGRGSRFALWLPLAESEADKIRF